jgi:(E)-4-hydroxy-3-methylbut-2-enyl-diphosphate synthase
MDVSIIGCVVNGTGEAEVSDLGLTGARNMSGFYLDSKRQRERLSNDDLVDQLEKRIRAKAALLDERNRIKVTDISN